MIHGEVLGLNTNVNTTAAGSAGGIQGCIRCKMQTLHKINLLNYIK